MLTFFRKLRKSLIADTSFSRYLFYALGEIALVVIGILIALQVNNWNEYHKLINQEIGILYSVKGEIEENLALQDSSLAVNQGYLNSMDQFLSGEFAGQTKEALDLFVSTINYRPATLSSPVLDEFLQTDRKLLLVNSPLLRSLRQMKSSYDWIEKTEYYLDEFWNDKITDFLIQNELGEIYHDPDIRSSKIARVISLPDNESFRSLISLKRDLQVRWMETQEESIRESQIVLEKVSQKLADH